MKRLFCLVLCLVLALTAVNVFAEGYQQHLPGAATFETLEEVKVNALPALKEAMGTDFLPDPALDTYPEGTTYVYRSAGMYTTLTAASRMNTNILVYVDQKFETKDAAYAYLQDLGLIDIIDEAYGSITLVTPIGAAFGAADQYAFYKLQAAMCNLGAAFTPMGLCYYAYGAYFGGATYRYLIGIDGGATFACDYIANTLDYVGRLAGMMLVNPTMNHLLKVAYNVPVYMVGATEEVVDKFVAVNEAYASDEIDGKVTYFNQLFPVRKVVVADAKETLAENVKDAYYNLLCKTMRTPVINSGLYVAAGEFYNYTFNQAPYTLTARNAIFNGVTADGIYVFEHQEDRFSDIVASNGEYMNTWYEFLPEEVLNNTANEHSIPLILCCHGGGDDAVQATDELGMIVLAGKERIAVISPRFASDLPGSSIFSASPFDLNATALPAMVEYMLETYPALDPSRVYVTGYSMGGYATVEVAQAAPQLFAAAVPMAASTPWGLPEITDEMKAAFETIDLPILFTTSGNDVAYVYDAAADHITELYQDKIALFAELNELDAVTYDFEAYPIKGFKADRTVTKLLNDEYTNTTWYLYNEAGVPIMGLNFTESFPHGLHPDYGTDIAWNYMKQFSRDTETGEVIFHAYAAN